ncbi:uncharacterized protein LOC143150425 [Ptiloglossa arizonensis]|uniref:uncharacterized protein LOC143150425 n=1 Tax=Ptiloglossa arizonensis TaxID=3350558 RepID=UPI003FA181DC
MVNGEEGDTDRLCKSDRIVAEPAVFPKASWRLQFPNSLSDQPIEPNRRRRLAERRFKLPRESTRTWWYFAPIEKYLCVHEVQSLRLPRQLPDVLAQGQTR